MVFSYYALIMTVFSGEGDAQAVAFIPQRHECLLHWQRGPVGGHTQAVQHQNEAPQHQPPLLARTVSPPPSSF